MKKIKTVFLLPQAYSNPPFPVPVTNVMPSGEKYGTVLVNSIWVEVMYSIPRLAVQKPVIPHTPLSSYMGKEGKILQ